MFIVTHVRHSVNSIVHIDNAKPRTVHKTKNYFQSYGFRHIPQPLCGLDINSRDFSFPTPVTTNYEKEILKR
jgi:hypothetical protein